MSKVKHIFVTQGVALTNSLARSFNSISPRSLLQLNRDTVSSVGAIIPRTLPFSAGTSMVNHFRQCLSLDEHRIRFSPQPYMSDTADTSVAEIRVKPTVKETWFAGCHSNIGKISCRSLLPPLLASSHSLASSTPTRRTLDGP